MTLPIGKISLCPAWSLKHECVFVEFLRLRANELTPGELTAVACTIACFERIRSTFPVPNSDLLTPDPKNTIMVERDMTLGEIDDCLAACDVIIDHLPPQFFQHVRDVTGLQDQLRKQWKLLDAENKLKGVTNWKGAELSGDEDKVILNASINQMIDMRDDFILLIKNKGLQFLSFDAMLCVCLGFKAIEDLENSIEGFPSSQRQDKQFDRLKLNDVDLPAECRAKKVDMKLPSKLLEPLKATLEMCTGNPQVLKAYGCFKEFLSLPSDPATKDLVYEGNSNPEKEIQAFAQLLEKAK